jgi:hypothetical protein
LQICRVAGKTTRRLHEMGDALMRLVVLRWGMCIRYEVSYE